MKNNIENLQLKNIIFVEKEIIPKDTCKFVINTIKDQSWLKHSWSSDGKSAYSYPTNELDVLPITDDLENILNSFIFKSVKSYNHFIGKEKITQVNYFSPIRFNRYQKNQIMRQHCDHIKDLFEGGIPILSIIINFNNDYEGGDLIFWDDYKVNLGEGDIVIFPSLFLFPHRVEKVTKNIRYSGVCWAW